MARVGSSGYADALAEPHTRPMEFTGRAMTGMVVVDPAGVATGRGARRLGGAVPGARPLTAAQTLMMLGTPGRNRTCAHGLGNHCSIR